MIVGLALAAALSQAPDAQQSIDSLIKSNQGQAVDTLVQAGLPPVDIILYGPDASAQWHSQTEETVNYGGCLDGTCSMGPTLELPTCWLKVQLDPNRRVASHHWFGKPTACRDFATWLLARRAAFTSMLNARQSLLLEAYRGQPYARIAAPGEPQTVKTADGAVADWSWKGRYFGQCTMQVIAGPDGLVRDLRLSGTSVDCIIKPALLAPSAGSPGQP